MPTRRRRIAPDDTATATVAEPPAANITDRLTAASARRDELEAAEVASWRAAAVKAILHVLSLDGAATDADIRAGAEAMSELGITAADVSEYRDVIRKARRQIEILSQDRGELEAAARQATHAFGEFRARTVPARMEELAKAMTAAQAALSQHTSAAGKLEALARRAPLLFDQAASPPALLIDLAARETVAADAI